MTYRKTIKTTVFATIVLTFSAGTSSAQGLPLEKCMAAAGSYVTSITDIEGVFQSRGLITLSGDGTFLINDSGQGGVEGIYQPFSASQGVWGCAEAKGDSLTLKAVGLNFTLPKDSSRSGFGRVDYAATYEISSQLLNGKIALRFSVEDDLESSDPLAIKGPAFEEFNFSAKRITMP